MSVEPAPPPPATDENPFAAPATGKLAFADANLADADDFDLIRLQCIRKEKNITCISWAMLPSGLFTALLGFLLYAYIPPNGLVLIACLVIIALGLCQAFGGFITKDLEPRGRSILVGCLGVSGLLSLLSVNPLNLLFFFIVLAMMYRKPADIVFSDRYRDEIIPATPHIRGRASILIWLIAITMAIIPLMVIALFLFAFLSAPAH